MTEEPGRLLSVEGWGGEGSHKKLDTTERLTHIDI